LPESALARIPGLDYAAAPDSASDAQRIETLLANSSDPRSLTALVSGFISRILTYKGNLVGGAEVTRLRRDPAEAERDDIVSAFLADFSQGTPSRSTIGDTSVWQVEGARGTKVGAVAWLDGNDVVLMWSSGLADARKLAAAYIAAS
jgi:hypothetical protein